MQRSRTSVLLGLSLLCAVLIVTPQRVPQASADSDRLARTVADMAMKVSALERRIKALEAAGSKPASGEEAAWQNALASVHARLARLEAGAPPFDEVPTKPPEQPSVADGYQGGAFAGRAPGARKIKDLQRDKGVLDALRWLKAHQSPGGQWEADGFQQWCNGRGQPRRDQPEGIGKQEIYDVGVTGLALCAFLGAGYTDRGTHEFKDAIRRGLRFLGSVQDPDGCIGPRSSPNYLYCHAIAAIALVEAYGMTGQTAYGDWARRALAFNSDARNPDAGWRYGVRPGDSDTSLTGWMVMAMHSAQLINQHATDSGQPAPFQIDEDAITGAISLIKKVTDARFGRVGYLTRGSGPGRPIALVDRFPAHLSESMTAVGVLVRIATGESRRQDGHIRKGAELCLKRPPIWSDSAGSIDMYYWYYGALAMHQMGARHWQTWRRALRKTVLGSQRQTGHYCQYKGSWNPVGPWGEDGGRVFSTAMMAMCLETDFRYERFYKSK